LKIEKDIVTGETRVTLDNLTVINRYSHIVAGAEIGSNTMVGQGCYVASGARIGNNCRIQNGNNIWDGVTIQNDVFIGPNVSLTNDHNPIAPCKIGTKAEIAAGSTVLRHVEDNERVYGVVK
jgi:UDP-3-O-[3-hydroxymyristoyl] glucosamine N-acyltransferase